MIKKVTALFLACSLAGASAQVGPIVGTSGIAPNLGPLAVASIGTGGCTSGTVTITVPAGGVPGNATIIAALWDASSTVGGTLTDNGVGNSYTRVTAAFGAGSTAQGFAALWYAPSVSPLAAGKTITYTTQAGGTTNCAFSVFYAVGVGALDGAVTAAATGNSTTPSVTSGTPATNNELFVATVCDVTATPSFVQASGFSTPPNQGSAGNGVAAYGGNLVNSGTGTKTFNPTIASAPWAALIMGFKP